MAGIQYSKIEWTDFSGGDLNFVWRGSSPGDCEAGPGCAHCYVKRIMVRHKDWPAQTTFFRNKLERLRSWQPSKKKPYKREWSDKPMAFVCDTGDLFHERVENWQIMYALDILSRRPDVAWQLLTKRADRMYEVIMEWLTIRAEDADEWEASVPRNIWLGVSVENQDALYKRVPYLTAIPARGPRYLSIEPMLGPISIHSETLGKVNWIIIGGESGSQARPLIQDWAIDLVQEAQDMATPCFVKQLGQYGRSDKGADPREWHVKLRVRDFPSCLWS